MAIDYKNITGKLLAGAVALIIIIAAYVFFVKNPRLVSITPGRNEYISRCRPTISIKWRPPLFGSLDPVQVSLDDTDITEYVEAGPKAINIKIPRELSEGTHYINARLRYKFILSKVVTVKWKFNIDTQAPYIEIGSDGLVGCRDPNTEISGLTEPGAKLRVRFNGKQLNSPSVYGGGTFFVNIHLSSKENTLELEAIDRAGNEAQRTLRVVIDNEPPVITGFWPNSKRKVRTVTSEVLATVDEEQSSVSSVSFKINGQKIHGRFDVASKRAQVSAVDLAEGNNIVELEVKDAAGNMSTSSWSFLVDSTEEFGNRILQEGAVGADVKELQARLLMHGFNIGRMASSYDSGTAAAVRSFQTANELQATGIIGPEELRILKPEKLDTSIKILNAHIVIYLSKRALQLFSGDKLIKVYPIAVGRGGQFKTPVGKHKIRKKIVNPTWYPPSWAGINHPIPPGPSNPLGNREIKLSKRGYSIHGTNKPMSVGSAATHGCIRMYPSDVLELFEVVDLGTPVEIRP